MATPADVLTRAASVVGTVEAGGPHGNDGNLVRFWDEIGMHAYQGQPYCAAGVTWCFLPFIPEIRFVYCPTGENWFRARGALITDPAKAAAGDVVFFRLGSPQPGHVGLVESVSVATRHLTTIEFNTSPGEAGSQVNGGGVYRRIRPFSVVRSLGRPAYTPGAAPPPPVVPRPVHFPGARKMRIPMTVPIGADGKGWIQTDVDYLRLESILVQGPFQSEAKPIPKAGSQDRGGKAHITLEGAPPATGAPYLFPIVVWTVDA